MPMLAAAKRAKRHLRAEGESALERAREELRARVTRGRGSKASRI